jgi:hypothetical protein
MIERILIRRYHKTTACLCVGPSARTERIGPHWTDFREIVCRVVFTNICREVSRPDKIGPKITCTLHQTVRKFMATAVTNAITVAMVTNFTTRLVVTMFTNVSNLHY